MIVNLWTLFRNAFTIRRRKRKTLGRYEHCALRGEYLEQRELLSANQIYFDPTLTAIIVEGTSGADTVNVWTDTSNVVHVTMENALGTQSSVFNRSGVGQVRFSGGDGDDTFRNTSNVSTLAVGEGGNDTLIGGLGANVLQGGIGNDQLTGNVGVDQIYGDGGNDVLDSGAGNDVLVGGTGIDALVAGDGDDYLYGEDGDDMLAGGAGNDVLAGGNGNDALYAGAGNDSVTGVDGDDNLYGEDGVDSLTGGIGNDTLNGGLHNDTLIGGTGNDTLIGDDGDDSLYGDEGADSLSGGVGNDYLNGGIDNDTLLGGVGNDSLTGFDGDDRLYGDDGIDWLSGGFGNDLLQGNIGNDTLLGGGGNDTLTGDDGDDNLYGEDGADYLAGGAGIDVLSGGQHNDTLFGGIGNDTLAGDDGDDYLYGEDGVDSLMGGLGNDSLQGGVGNDMLFGGAGNDTLSGEDGDDSIYGDDGADFLAGGAGIDLLYGGIGNDLLFGGIGNDVLTGEDGDDYLYGEDGADLLAGGIGNDLLIGSTGNDSLLAGVGNDVLYGEGDDDNLYGEDGADFLSGGVGNDFLYGGLHNDTIYGGIGNDTLAGDDGDDLVYGEDGADSLTGGAGNDVLDGGTGNDTLFGGLGNDSLAGQDGDDNLYGEDGADYLTSGAGNNYLNGGLGNDTIIGGVGYDVLVGEDGDDHLYGGDGADSLTGGNGNDLLVAGAGNDSLFGSVGNDVLAGEDGDDILYGEDGADYLMGGAGNDRLSGGTGNDTIYGGIGNDTLTAESGDDSLYGEDGIDALTGGAGNNLLDGGAGNDLLLGGAGVDTLLGGFGDDNLYGEGGADVLEGSAGNDMLEGDVGNDVLIGGLGQDQVYGNDGEDLLVGGTTAYDQDPVKLRDLANVWSMALPYSMRIAFFENELSALRLMSNETVFDDQVADTLFGGAQQDWFLQTGFASTYRPDDVEPMPEDEGDDHTQIISDTLPALEGFAFIDSLDKLSDRATDETLSTLVPYANDPTLQREHLSTTQLVRYDQVTNYAVASGAWSNPATWRNGVVPANGARVLIPIGVNVEVDDMIAARLATVRIDGTLSFITTRNSELRVDTMIVTGSGTFEMGTVANPIANGVNARLLITDNGPIDRSWDPFGISRGLISHGNVSIYGAEVSSYAALAAPALAGTSVITLKSTPVGWKAGDTLVLAATTQGATQNEVRRIQTIIGKVVILDQALAFNHFSPGIDLDVHVANVTRNAVIESEGSEADRRGHVMFMHDRDVHVAYGGFYKLGRTDKSKPINDPVLNSDWTLKAGTGTNPRARYAVHFHRNGLVNDGNPATILGSAVVDSPGWGFVNHTSYVDMTENVAFDVSGAGFVSETGSEIGGFYRNIAIGSTGTTEAMNAREGIQDFGFQGDGFWFQGAGVSVIGNIAAGNQKNGFVFYTRGLIEGGVQQQFLSANLADPSIAQGAEKIAVASVPIRQFSDNVGYASYYGLVVRYHLEFATHGANSIYENSTFWNNETGVYLPYTQYTVLRNLKVITNATPKPVLGVAGNIQTQNITYDNLNVSGYYFGIDLPRRGTNIVTGGTFNNVVDILLYTAALNDRYVLITGVPATTSVTTVVDVSGFGYPVNTFFVNDVILLNFGIFSYQRLYFNEQRANYIPFPLARPDAPAAYIGLTNQQLWDEFDIALGGAIAPANAITAPNIGGLLAV